MCECERRCSVAGIRFTFTIHSADFIRETSARLGDVLFGTAPPAFDAAIANPPYRKISADSTERHALRSVGVETSNLYTGFIALIQRLLVPGGQLVGITPRSFCNGPYFRPFREDFLSHLELRRLHVFDSRQAAFRDDSVLQENIIFHAVKGRNQPDELTISSSSGEHGAGITETVFPFTEIVHPRDPEKFIHIPSAASHARAKKTMDGLRTSLASLGVTVSTGRVVDFRLKDSLRMEPERGTVPLLYPCHFNGGTVHWPKLEARKPNAILDNDETRPWLVPSGVYLLTKRFTSKEERRRLVACLFDPDLVKAEWVGFENHLNYFHASGQGLERTLALGLHAFLNSTVVDQYFRRFSGHTQVNATDLRTLAYPDRDTLQAMGRDMNKPDLDQDGIDQLVTQHLHASR
jgi:adenine-specific DNA-methyltransferase